MVLGHHKGVKGFITRGYLSGTSRYTKHNVWFRPLVPLASLKGESFDLDFDII
jgi:hypothetical protein